MFRCGKSVTCTSSEFDGLGLQNLCEVANIKLLDSKVITREFYEKVVNYCHKELHLGCCSSPRSASDKIKLEELRNSMNEKIKRCNNILNETGSSNWLSLIPMHEFSYIFINNNFRTPSSYDMVGIFQVYQLVACVKKVSVISTSSYVRRKDSLHCDTTKWEV